MSTGFWVSRKTFIPQPAPCARPLQAIASGEDLGERVGYFALLVIIRLFLFSHSTIGILLINWKKPSLNKLSSSGRGARTFLHSPILPCCQPRVEFLRPSTTLDDSVQTICSISRWIQPQIACRNGGKGRTSGGRIGAVC